METMLHRGCFNSAQGQQKMSKIHTELLGPLFSLSLLIKKIQFQRTAISLGDGRPQTYFIEKLLTKVQLWFELMTFKKKLNNI